MERGSIGIATSGKDIVPVLGSSFSKSIDKGSPGYEAAVSHLRYLYQDVNDLKHRYISLGFHLYEYDAHAWFVNLGFSDIYEFAEANLGMEKSAVSRCIAVAREFSRHENPFSVSMFLDDTYKDYSYSQLCEMVSMRKEDRWKVKPEMSVRQIRDFKKQLKEGVKKVDKAVEEMQHSESVVTSQQEEIKEKERKLFDYQKYAVLSGAAQKTYIKSRDVLGDPVSLHVFDCNGEPVFPELYTFPLDLLCQSDGRIYIRLHQSMEELRGI